MVLMLFFALWSYFTSVLMYECVRLLHGNYRMRQNGIDFELLLANYKHISTYGSHAAFGFSSPWLSYTFTSSGAIAIAKYFYILSLLMQSVIGLILCQYTIDNVVQWADGGTAYALQLLPEAKFLTDYKQNENNQPFAGNYFALSAGFGITLLLSLLYGLIFHINQKQDSKIQGIKCFVIFVFLTVSIMSFLKPYLHMSTGGELRVDDNSLKQKFSSLPMWTPNFGLAFGILAYSSTLSQQSAVPELLINTHDQLRGQRDPSRDYFRLPLFISTLLACFCKCLFAIAGAMMFTDQSNVFDNMLFSANTPDATLIALTAFTVVVVLPQSIDL